MQFTLVEACYTPFWQEVLLTLLFLALPVGLPLFGWLRRSPRNTRDVLSANDVLQVAVKA